MRRLWPTSLVGQLALVVAIALFVAQAINFTLLLQGGRSLRQAQITAPAIARLLDAADRDAGGRGGAGRMRAIDVATTDPAATGGEHHPEVEAAIRRAFADAGRSVGGVSAVERKVTPASLPRPLDRREMRILRTGHELVVSAEVRPGRWLSLRSPWPRSERWLMWRLAGQTAIIYILVLGVVYWAGRRIARPLRALSVAAREFTPTDPGEPVAMQGPDDVRALIDAFNTLRRRVVAMLDEKDRMLGAIGHDLRTPLAALRVRIESCEDEGDRAKMADTIDGMNRMLDDILSLARLGRGGESATETDIVALVDAVVEDFRDLDAPVSYDPEGRIVRRVRPAAIRRAVTNLIDNAVKYAGAAEVSVSRDGPATVIAVRDRGPGIPADQLDAVFEPFTRLETSRNRDTGGSGLGLALARAIASDAGGTLTMANRPGGGLEAILRLG